ncbi:hypothetical protein [Pelomonas sp. Root662]|uniref:hypothetical protein n=1 Tax=Pelomonas sp. Root662 TaxID=1736580 RepID=UPI001F29BE0F|nr:hypothetical protein [Pelomonas sp. Root662]
MSTRPVIEDEVRRFVLTSVPSVPYAEAVLLLRLHADKACTGSDVARALYISERAALELLQVAREAGVLEETTAGYRYQPRDEQLAKAWDQFAACYAANLIGVTQIIHSATHKSAHLFADAFKLRREP